MAACVSLRRERRPARSDRFRSRVRPCSVLSVQEVLGRALRQRTLDLVVGESTILQDDESIDIFEQLAPIKAHLFVRTGHPLAASGATLRDVLGFPLAQVSRLPPRLLKPFSRLWKGLQCTGRDAPFRRSTAHLFRLRPPRGSAPMR